jgi:hypothetical protein
MRLLKGKPPVVGAEDISMAERLQAVSCRGKLEATVYDGWQLSEPIRPRRCRSSTVEA